MPDLVPVEQTPLEVVACPHPFRLEQVRQRLEPGMSLQEILERVQPDPWLRSRALVWVNGEYVPQEAWATTWPLPGALIAIRVVPAGGVGRIIGGIFLAVAMLAASVFVPPLFPFAAGSFGAMLVGGLAALSVGIVGTLILNALIPPMSPTAPRLANLTGTSKRDEESPVYSLTGSQNRANLWGPIPKIYGRHRLKPFYGAETYTESLGNVQYLRMLFVWGFGPLKIEDLKIGETALSEFEGVELEHRNLIYNGVTYGDDPLTLYTNDIHEEALQIELKYQEYVVRTTKPGADEISIDITCPSGLYAIDQNGNMLSYSVVFVINARKTGTEEWAQITQISLNGSSRQTVRGGYRWKTKSGPTESWDIMVGRLTQNDDTFHISQSYWTALRTIKYSAPINFPHPIAITAMRIRATGRLNGVVDEFSGIATSILPDWDPATQTWVTRETQNPASCFRETLQGLQNQRPFPDSRVDLTRLQEWHEYCETEGWKYNRVADYKGSLQDRLAEIASAGRAALTVVDNRFSVIIDRPQEFAVGPAFTPRNSADFRSHVLYPDIPHAFRCPFLNENTDWQQDERIVLADGYQIDGLDAWGNSHPEYPPATVFEQIEFAGTTDPDLIFRRARYHLADVLLRREQHELTVGIEHLVAVRGDRVKLAHDVLLAGLTWGRVKSLIINPPGYLGGVTVDEICPMLQAGVSYAVRFRLGDNTTLLCNVVTVVGYNLELIFTSPISLTNPHPAEGDLFMFGPVGLEAIDCIIRSIQPTSNLHARLTLVPYDEAIYQADQGNIPAYDPKISQPSEWWVPVVGWVRSGGDALIRDTDGSWQSRILITLQRPAALDPAITQVEAQFWQTDSDIPPTTVLAPLDDLAVSLVPVEDKVSYSYRLRYVRRDGSQGPWTEVEQHTVEGKTAPPEDVTGFTVYQVQEFVSFVWTANPDLDIAGYELRFGNVGSTWEESELITTTTLATNFSTPLIPPGIWDFLIKAIDTSGNYSKAAARQTYRVVMFYHILANPQNYPLWAGTLINMLRNPLTCHLVPVDQALASGDNFDVFDNFVVNPYSTYGYEAPEIDLGTDGAARAWSLIYSNLGPGKTGTIEPTVQLDYRIENGSYDGFEDWVIGLFVGRYVKARVMHTSVNGDRIITDFQPVIDRSY